MQRMDEQWPRDLVSARSQAEQLVLASYEESALSLMEYARRVVAYAEGAGERARRSQITKRIAIARDAWAPVVRASLQNWTTPAVFKAVLGASGDHIDVSRNPAKHIWQELSVSYKFPAKRTTPKKPADGERYVELLEGTGFDLFWAHVEFLLVACNEVLVWPDVIERKPGAPRIIKHRVAAPNTFTLVTTKEDPSEIECVCIIDDFVTVTGEHHRVYKLWTDEWHASFEKNSDGELQRVGRINETLRSDVPEQDNSAANPYGGLHHVLIRSTPWADQILDATSGEDLVDLTLRGGEERQFYRYAQKMSGFKQGACVGQSIEELPEQLLDPGAILRIETDGSFQIIDWQLDLGARLECMTSDEVNAAAANGINPERYKRTGNYQNTTSAQLAERGLSERRARQVSIFRDAEARYKRSLCIVAEAHKLEDVPDPDIRLEVEHAPMAYPYDPAQQLTVETGEVAMGLESQVTLVKRRHPEWTDKECRAYLDENMKVIASINEAKTRANVPADPTKQSASAEQNGAMGPAARDGTPMPPPPAAPQFAPK